MNKQEIIDKYGSVRAAARAMGMAESTLRCRLDRSEMSGKNDGENVGEELTQPSEKTSEKSNQNGLPEAKQPKKDALTAICDAMGILPEEVAGGWLRDEKATIRVKRTQTFVPQELTPQFVELLDSARRTVLRPSECQSANTMMVVSLHDAHFGKLAWHKEVGEDYTPSIAASIYRQAVSDALVHFNPARIAKIVLPIGSDMLNQDNAKSETTSGTRVDSVDDRIHKVFDIAVAAVIAAVEDCVAVADTEIIVIPGNHDETLSILIAKVLKQYFRFDKRVTVDDSELSRKYLHWGKNLICFTHRFSRPAAAPSIMAVERPKEWANSVCREVHTGHLHTRKATVYEPYSEYHGVMVRVLPSIAPTDRWHSNMGFIGNLRAAETLLYSEDTGILDVHTSRVRL